MVTLTVPQHGASGSTHVLLACTFCFGSRCMHAMLTRGCSMYSMFQAFQLLSYTGASLKGFGAAVQRGLSVAEARHSLCSSAQESRHIKSS